jgi:hypothetical protein
MSVVGRKSGGRRVDYELRELHEKAADFSHREAKRFMERERQPG